MKLFQKPINDQFFQNLSPIEWLWMFHNWQKDQEEENKKLQEQAIMIGAFHNPEMARKMLKTENPDYESDDEMYEKTLEYLKNNPLEKPQNQTQSKKKKKRRILNQKS